MACAFLTWCTHVGKEQDRIMAGFCSDEKIPTAIAELTQEESAAVKERFHLYADGALADDPVELRLTPVDLNAAVAALPALAEYEGMVSFTEIRADGAIFADICLPLRRRDRDGFRYLVGQGEFKFERVDHNVHLTLVKVIVPGKEVPEGFQGHFAKLLWLVPFQNNEDIAAVFERSELIEFEEGAVTISNYPGPAPAPVPSPLEK